MKRAFKIILAVAIISTLNSPLSTLPAQDAIYNLIRRQYTVNSDGSIDMRYRKEIQLLRNRAITAYADKGETFILHNPAIERLTINESYTIRKDGSRVPTPPNAFINQLPSGCADCGRYNGIRELVVVHTALEPECTIVLDYTIRHRGQYGWAEVLDLVQDCPVKRYEVIIDVAKGLKWEVTPSGDDSKIKNVNDGHTYHIVADNLEQSIIENYQATDYPRLAVNLLSDRLANVKSEDINVIIPDAENIIAELYDKEPLTWAQNIRDYVVDNVRTVDLMMRLVDHHRASPTEVFRSNCGTIEEKSDLLVVLLRQAGLKAKANSPFVEVTVSENGNSLTYKTSCNKKTPFRLEGAALDEQRTINITRQLSWKGTDIGGGFSQMSVPTEDGSINIDPAWLSSERKSPLRVRNCNENYHYTIPTPRGCRLVKPVKISYTKKGIGSLAINISQMPDGTIDVSRQLNIDVENGIVTAKQYKAFRQMIQDWHHYNTIVICQ